MRGLLLTGLSSFICSREPKRPNTRGRRQESKVINRSQMWSDTQCGLSYGTL